MINKQKHIRLNEIILVIEQEVPKPDLSNAEEQYVMILESIKQQDNEMYHLYLDKWIQLDYERFAKLNSTYGKGGGSGQ